MDKLMDGMMDGWMHSWIDEWMDGWMDGWMGGWLAIHGYVYIYIVHICMDTYTYTQTCVAGTYGAVAARQLHNEKPTRPVNKTEQTDSAVSAMVFVRS